MQTARACQAQELDDMSDPLEPLKISSALKSELLKLQFRKAEKPESISPLDYTIISALKKRLKRGHRTRDKITVYSSFWNLIQEKISIFF